MITTTDFQAWFTQFISNVNSPREVQSFAKLLIDGKNTGKCKILGSIKTGDLHISTPCMKQTLHIDVADLDDWDKIAIWMLLGLEYHGYNFDFVTDMLDEGPLELLEVSYP